MVDNLYRQTSSCCPCCGIDTVLLYKCSWCQWSCTHLPPPQRSNLHQCRKHSNNNARGNYPRLQEPANWCQTLLHTLDPCASGRININYCNVAVSWSRVWCDGSSCRLRMRGGGRIHHWSGETRENILYGWIRNTVVNNKRNNIITRNRLIGAFVYVVLSFPKFTANLSCICLSIDLRNI